MSEGLLNVGASALIANQLALQTVGNNIANVNSTGYSRQTVDMTDVPGQYTGSGYVGQGVNIVTIQRNYSSFLGLQSNVADAQQSADSTLSQQLQQMQSVFQTGAGDLGATMNGLFNDVAQVASSPTDMTARSVVINDIQRTATQFNTAAKQLDDLQTGALGQLQQSATAINGLAAQIASVNSQISRAMGSGQPPNNLLDQRDQLISQLNQYVQTTSLPASDGTVGIFLANSQPLVLGNVAHTVAAGPSAFPADPSGATLSLQQGNVTVPLDQTNLGGGSVKGLLGFMNQNLVQGRNMLGRMALAVSTVVNTQNQLGLKLNGAAGGNLFQAITLPTGYPASTNAGTASLSMSVNTSSSLVASDYQVNFATGTTGTIKRLSDGQVSNFNTAAPPIQFDGLTLAVTAGAVAGDQFLLKPMASAATQMAAATTSPSDLAAANPVQMSGASTNKGSLAVSSLSANSPNANLTATVTLTFNAATSTFNVVGTGTGNPVNVPYVPGQPISYNGWTLKLTGTPQTGDVMTLQAANPAYLNTNSGNASSMTALRDATMFDGAPLSDGYAEAIAQVGNMTQSAKSAATTSQSIAANLQSSKASVSGVNLDEEAAKLLQFQQAYTACGKMMQVAQSLFTNLIQSLSA